MAALTNFRMYTHQAVDAGFMIVTEDSEAGVVDVHDRRSVVVTPADAWHWMNPETTVKEAAHIADQINPNEQFVWWKVDRAVNRADPNNNGKHLLAPVSGSA
jgi:putative SOS response-associated peptidase YedK